jgi:hypothetical protein
MPRQLDGGEASGCEKADGDHVPVSIHRDGPGRIETTAGVGETLAPQFGPGCTVKLDDREIATCSSVPENPRCDHVSSRIHCHGTGHVGAIGGAIDYLAPDLGTAGLTEFDDSEVAARVRIREVACGDDVAGRVHRDSVGAITALSGRCRAVDNFPP